MLGWPEIVGILVVLFVLSSGGARSDLSVGLSSLDGGSHRLWFRVLLCILLGTGLLMFLDALIRSSSLSSFTLGLAASLNVLARPVSYHQMSASVHRLILSLAVLLLLAAVPASYQLGREHGVQAEGARYTPTVWSGRLVFLRKSETGFDQSGVRNSIPDTFR